MSEIEIKIITISVMVDDKPQEYECVIYDQVTIKGKEILLLILHEDYKVMQDAVSIDIEALKLHILLVYKNGMVRVTNEEEIQEVHSNLGGLVSG